MAIPAGLRNKFIDFDARRQPKTTLYCIACQKDLDPSKGHRFVHLIGPEPFAIHPDDARAYEPSGDEWMSTWTIGNDCARKLGLEWTENHAFQPKE